MKSYLNKDITQIQDIPEDILNAFRKTHTEIRRMSDVQTTEILGDDVWYFDVENWNKLPSMVQSDINHAINGAKFASMKGNRVSMDYGKIAADEDMKYFEEVIDHTPCEVKEMEKKEKDPKKLAIIREVIEEADGRGMTCEAKVRFLTEKDLLEAGEEMGVHYGEYELTQIGDEEKGIWFEGKGINDTGGNFSSPNSNNMELLETKEKEDKTNKEKTK